MRRGGLDVTDMRRPDLIIGNTARLTAKTAALSAITPAVTCRGSVRDIPRLSAALQGRTFTQLRFTASDGHAIDLIASPHS